jgi:hypothetical protein
VDAQQDLQQVLVQDHAGLWRLSLGGGQVGGESGSSALLCAL